MTFLAVGLGEILWDVLPHTRMLGGAPANFAYHVNALGGFGLPVSRVGDDDLGSEALTLLVRSGLNIDSVSVDPVHPTGTVDAQVDANGVATYVFPDDVAWDFITLDEAALNLAAKADAVCFGTLAQRSGTSRQAIHRFLDAADRALKVYDINLRQHFYSERIITDSLAKADVLKINDDELVTVRGMFGLPADDRPALEAPLARHELTMAVLTRGGRGSLIVTPDEASDLPGGKIDIADTIGAGDSFTASLVLAHLNGWPLREMHERASKVAAYVCTRPGAMPFMPDDLKIGGLR